MHSKYKMWLFAAYGVRLLVTFMSPATVMVKTWLNGTGFAQFYLPPTRLSMNGMSYPAFIL